MKESPISVEDYLRNELLEANETQAARRFSKPVNQVTHLHKHEHSTKMEIEEDDIVTNTHTNMPYMIQPLRCMKLENTELVKQNDNRTRQEWAQQTNTKPGNFYHYKIWKDKQKTGETLL